MAVTTTIVIKHEQEVTSQTVENLLVRPAAQKHVALNGLIKLLSGIISGQFPARVSIKVDDLSAGDRASQTVAVVAASLVATTDTLTVGDVTLTWVVSAANENQITIGGSNAACATALAAAINAHTQLAGIVTASASSGTVTITSALPGRIGEMITLAEAGNGQTLGGAALAGVTATNAAAVRDHGFGVA